jgi:serine/threonine protein kinase
VVAVSLDEIPVAESFWIGTRDYISPEQYADAGQVTDRADIFSVGLMGVRLLSGRLPDRDRALDMSGIPAGFAEILSRALEIRPERRPSALDMAKALAALPV